MATTATGLIRVGRLEELTTPALVSGGRHGIAVFVSEGKAYAVDNRCPHMGFPLQRGSVCDGILTCHWHHARFDLVSGGTFDPWADDVRTYETTVEDGVVYVDPRPRPLDVARHWQRRLREGLEQSLSLVLVKGVLALREAGAPDRDVLEIGGSFGARYRERGWGPGLTIMTAMGKLLPALAPDDQSLALYHGLVHVSRDTAGEPPRFQQEPLPDSGASVARLKVWFRQFIEVRDAVGAERALVSAIAAGAAPAELADMLFAAATDHVFLDGGHTLDFINKACELLDLVGWQKTADILPAVIPGLAMARRSEELNNWRHPVDLIALIEPSLARLREQWPGDRGAAWGGLEALSATLLGEDPAASVAALDRALADGVALTTLSQALSYAAALRVARFHTSNEFADWITVLHTFTYANALHQALKRAPSPELARGLYHGAARLYLDRFLNIPAARLPEQRGVDDLPREQAALLDELADLLDREQQVNEAARVVHRYLSLGHDPAPLIAALGHCLLREDGEFHSYQMLEAGLALDAELRPERPEAANRVLVAVARYLAAHAPTSRAMLQTARTALRLQRGETVYAEDEEEAAEAADA